MEKKIFKTNIKCEGCVAKVTPALNELAGEGNWQVDLSDPTRKLTLEKDVDQQSINEKLKDIGYHVEQL